MSLPRPSPEPESVKPGGPLRNNCYVVASRNRRLIRFNAFLSKA